jgi:hypothetical protein
MLNSALSNQRIDATPDSVDYVVHALTDFSRADRLYDNSEYGYGVEPLALMYADVVYSTDVAEWRQALRRLGGVALFIAGMFPHSLSRKLVDVDYYVAMGGSAYGELSSSRLHHSGLNPVYAELSSKFTDFVDALAEVGSDANFSNDSNFLRSYENWLRTGSQRAARHFRGAGIDRLRLTSAVVNIDLAVLPDALKDELEAIYEIQVPLAVQDFMITERAAISALAVAPPARIQEVLYLVEEDDGGAAVSLFIDECVTHHLDDDGQMLSGSFMDYAVPRAADSCISLLAITQCRSRPICSAPRAVAKAAPRPPLRLSSMQ